MSNSKQRRQAKRQAEAPSRDGLQNLVAGLGTSRDKMAYSEYALSAPLDRQTLENMYRASWLAKKIVNIPAEDMTREWRQIMFDDEEASEESQFAVEDAERKFQVQAKVTAAIKWARLFGGAVMVLGVGDPKDYDKPLDPAKVKKDDLRFLLTLDRWMCVPSGTYSFDITSPSFLLPEYYTIAQAKNVRLHHSRVIRFLGAELPYMASLQVNRWGDSELQVAYDTLRGRDTITSAIATMMFEANVDVIKAEGLTDLVSTKDGEDKLTKRFQIAGLMKSFNRMLVLDGSEEYEKKSNSFSGLDSIIREFRSEVAGAADIPVSRLFGISASGLNATGDNEVRNYYDMLSARQEANLRPQLEMLDEVLVRSTLGNMPDDYRFEFKPLWQHSESELATMQKTRADRDKIYVDMGVVTEAIIARELKEAGTYPTMTDDDVSLAEELGEAMNEARMKGAENGAQANQGKEGQQGGQPPEGGQQKPEQGQE